MGYSKRIYEDFSQKENISCFDSYLCVNYGEFVEELYEYHKKEHKNKRTNENKNEKHT